MEINSNYHNTPISNASPIESPLKKANTQSAEGAFLTLPSTSGLENVQQIKSQLKSSEASLPFNALAASILADLSRNKDL